MTRCIGTGVARRGAHGFTLVEVLLGTVLLAAGLALAFATLTAAMRTSTRGEAMAEYNEQVRAVGSFMRTRIAGARPVPFGFDQATALPQRFVGERDRMRFVADLPNYLGQGGPYLHDFAIGEAEGGVRLTLALSMVQAGAVIEEAPRPPEVLVEGLQRALFRYRALDSEGRLSEWRERWDTMEQLPVLVEVTLHDEAGRAWPPLVVRLPLATASIGSGITP